jgi:2-phospho-L-lactate guanylyltransferase (CobY/MobA/RfbA family)
MPNAAIDIDTPEDLLQVEARMAGSVSEPPQ